jgi:UDP-glucuronate 4-epimerase
MENEGPTPRRVLVTGAAGFVGSHVVDRLLADGREVWGLDNFDAFYSRETKESNLVGARGQTGFRFAEGDLRNETFLTEIFQAGQFDAVVHLAARAGVRPSIQQPDDYYDCNVMGTVRVLEAMRRFRVPALVFASSSSVYGSREDGEAFSEDDPVDRPVSPYAATKRAGELLCHTYWHLHELRCLCLRLFTVYGPRQRPDLAIHKFAREISNGRPVPLYGDGSSERDYTYVDDAVVGICRALDRVATDDGTGFEILNIGANRTIQLSEMVRLLGEAMDTEPEVTYLPPQPGDVPRTWANVSRAQELLGYEPKMPFEEGVRRFVSWFQARPAAVAVEQS